MSNTYLFEVGLEEIPAKYVRQSSEQLTALVKDYLSDARLTYDQIESYGTPRRLAVLISGLPEKQEDLIEVAKGPAKRIAQDEAGNWTKAAEGFARGKQASVDDIYFEEIKGEDYAHVKVTTKGLALAEVLANLHSILNKMTFPVSMHWADHDFKFIRPIHWFVSLLNDTMIPFTFLDITADRITRGHRYLSSGDVTINNASEYVEKLAAAYVIVDQEKRKEMIVSQINAIAKNEHYQVELDEELLEEVSQIVEYPTAFIGDFDEKYLELPREVLITSMKNHQRYFYVTDQNDSLQAKFISVRNGNDQQLDNVKKGNQKVLTARLEDGLFFINEDKKATIDDYAKKLETVMFHSEIGTMAEKMQRVGQIADYLYQKWQNTSLFAEMTEIPAKIQRASHIYKFDLVTGIVDEFSELQGIMGEKYALDAGEDKEVAQAIREHYLPTGQNSKLPMSALGTLMAVSDKLDSIISFFKIDRIPSGSNDPFALRRQMIGIVTILDQLKLPFDWNSDLSKLLTEVYPGTEDMTTLVSDINRFLNDRVKQLLQNRDMRFDIIEAVIASTAHDVNKRIAAAEIIAQNEGQANFKAVIEAWNRVLNLREKAESLNVYNGKIDKNMLSSTSEQALYAKVEALVLTDDLTANYQQLADLAPEIKAFFENNMVFTDDEAVRDNRLALLSQIIKAVLTIADTNKLQVK